MFHLPAAIVLACSALGGYVASRLGVPLAWVLGALVPTAVGSMMGIPVLSSRRGRKVGQLLVGASVGMYVSVDAVEHIGRWFPVMILTAIVSVLISAVVCVAFARVNGTNLPTAFFSMTPGGLSEMAFTGEREGARREIVTMSHTIRVALIVTIMPFLLLKFGTDGGLMQQGHGMETLSPDRVVIILAVAALSVFLVSRTGVNNPWMIGALLGAGIVASMGYIEGRMPYPLFALGQFLMGISIGSGFKRDMLTKAPRIFATSALFVLAMTALLFGYAALVHWATGIDLSSMTLAASPGGQAEMALTAQALHLNVALITAFHVIRSFTVNAFSLQFYRFFNRIGFLPWMDRTLSRLWPPTSGSQ